MMRLEDPILEGPPNNTLTLDPLGVQYLKPQLYI